VNYTTAILQLICPDRSGLVSEISGWIAQNGGNIRHADHHVDDGAALFLSRIEWDINNFSIDRALILREVNKLASHLSGKAQLNFSDEKINVAIFVSKQSHCLVDLLWRVQSDEMPMNVPLIISNHEELRSVCEQFNVRFEYVPVILEDKFAAEKKMLQLLLKYNIKLVVLAKYMQILSAKFLQEFPSVINIHHSFLPAFKGAQPYHRAWERGVKLIGATAHYVTEDLDDGPIIEQMTAQVSHRDEIKDLIRKGRDTERIALARALMLHLRRQVIIYGGRTAIFA
tara:strand:- start:66 stop:920 length:855 start_codon:yes stop_codon:yes gene_type:complete